MATLTVQSVTSSGVSPSYASAASGGDKFPWSEHAFVHVKNGDASSHTVTIPSQYSTLPPGQQSKDLTVSVPAGGEKIIGPFYGPAFKDSNGDVILNYSAVTSVTVGVFKL